MYTRRNKTLVISLAGLVILIVALYSTGTKKGFDTIDKELYRVAEIAEIDEVRLKSRENNIVLKYEGSRWQVNNNYNADSQLITVLFATLREVEPKRLVSATHIDSLRKHIESNGVFISLLKNNNTLKEFYVGGNTQKTKAYFQDANNGPHLVSIPGYRVYVSGIFEVDELGWRSKRIFDLNWYSFKKLSAIFSNDKQRSFEVTSHGTQLGITGLREVDTTKLYNYLDAISLLTADKFVPTGFSKHYDSLIQTPPMVRLEVMSVDSNKYHLALYPPGRQNKDILGKEGKNTIAVFKRANIAPLLRGKDYFVLKHP